MPRKNFVLAALASLAISVGSAANADTISPFTDPGTFTNWSEATFGGNVDKTPMATDGNPGDWLELLTVPTGADGLDFVVGAFINPDATWNPSTQGAINNLSMTIDAKSAKYDNGQIVTNQGDGQSLRVAVLQNGIFYEAVGPLTYSPADWTNFGKINVSGSSFTLLDPKSEHVGAPDHPDFTASGSPIKFGFMVANSGSAAISGTDIGYDNWALTLYTAPPPPTPQVPEPASLSLFGLGLAGFGFMRRRKRAA